jgi:hypothetical protein
MEGQPPSGLTTHFVLAVGWLPGAGTLCCLGRADTYNGMLDAPSPPTTWTWIFFALFLAWLLLIPAAGIAISLRRTQKVPALVYAAALVVAVGLAALVLRS